MKTNIKFTKVDVLISFYIIMILYLFAYSMMNPQFFTYFTDEAYYDQLGLKFNYLFLHFYPQVNFQLTSIFYNTYYFNLEHPPLVKFLIAFLSVVFLYNPVVVRIGVIFLDIILITYLIYKYEERGLLYSIGIFLLGMATIGAFNLLDSFEAVFSIFALDMLKNKHNTLSGLFTGLAIGSKEIGLFLIPVSLIYNKIKKNSGTLNAYTDFVLVPFLLVFLMFIPLLSLTSNIFTYYDYVKQNILFDFETGHASPIYSQLFIQQLFSLNTFPNQEVFFIPLVVGYFYGLYMLYRFITKKVTDVSPFFLYFISVALFYTVLEFVNKSLISFYVPDYSYALAIFLVDELLKRKIIVLKN